MWRSPGIPLARGAVPLGTAFLSTWLVLLIGCLHDATVVNAAKLPDIYWNSSNPMFRIDNTDHIIDVNRGNQPYDFDQVDIICPSYPVGTPPRNMETYIIYLVTRHEYETCTLLRSSASRLVAKCNGNAGRALKYTITFRSFTPQPGGHEFRPGSDYYLISTSSGRPAGLKQDHGGACQEHNMKLTFKVCCDPHDESHHAPPVTQSNNTANGSTERAEETTERWTPFRRLPSAPTDVSRIPSGGRDRHRAQAAAGYDRGGNGLHRDTGNVLFTTTRRIHTQPPDGNTIGRNGGVLVDQQQQQQDLGFSETEQSSSSDSSSSSSWCLLCDQSHLVWLVIVACVAAALSTVFVIR